MAKLIIKGETRQLLKIQKAYRSLVSRHVVTCSLEEDKDQEDESSPESESLLTAAKTIELIEKCTLIEELYQYKSDERKTVQKAIEKKLKELE